VYCSNSVRHFPGPSFSTPLFGRHFPVLHFQATQNKLVFPNTMHKVKAHISGELFVKNMLTLQHHFAMLDFET